MPEIIDVREAASMVAEHDSVMIGGFLACGAPERIIDEILKVGIKNLHMIVICTDFVDKGAGKLITNKQIKSVQTSHIGTNRSTQEQFNAGTLKVEFNPQGTLAERIRAGGAGLGGILTPTGVGTDLDKEREIIEVDGKKFFLEKPINADFALIRAHKADRMGNLVYSKSARNANPLMAMAAKITIVEVDEIVETGQLDPECIITSGIFVNYIVKRGE